MKSFLVWNCRVRRNEMSALKKEVMVIESSKEISEILDGSMWDIIVELMLNDLGDEELISRLEISPLKLRLYLSRLENLKIIERKERKNRNKMNYKYTLCNKNLEVICNEAEDLDLTTQALLNVKRFSRFLSNGFKNSVKYKNEPSKYGAVFIKCNTSRVEEFKQKLNHLLDEFKAIEDEDEESNYLFMPMLFPYGQNESEDE